MTYTLWLIDCALVGALIGYEGRNWSPLATIAAFLWLGVAGFSFALGGVFG